MMKKYLILILFASVLAFSSNTVSQAEQTTFTVSARIPSSNSVSIVAASVNSSTGAFTTVNGTALSFDPLTFDSVNQIYTTNHFFALDIANSGSGDPDVTVTYTEGANPNNDSNEGLGHRAKATFVKVGAGGSEVNLTAHGPTKSLADVSNEQITSAELSGSFLRIYVGLGTGDSSDPADVVPFTAADSPGNYDGTLFISATVS